MRIAHTGYTDAKSSVVYVPTGGVVTGDEVSVRVGDNVAPRGTEVRTKALKCAAAIIETGLPAGAQFATWDATTDTITVSASVSQTEDRVIVSKGATALPHPGQSGYFRTSIERCLDTLRENGAY